MKCSVSALTGLCAVVFLAYFGLSPGHTLAGGPAAAPLDAPVATPTATPTGTPFPCAPVWSVVPSPNVGMRNNHLSAVAALSSNDIWAVGAYNTGGTWDYRSLTEHWDGSEWAVVPSPDPPGGTYILLNGVAAVSANDVWAVGLYFDGSVYQPLIEHWDGTAWSIVSGPLLEAGGALAGVVAVLANDVWAVGYYGSGTNFSRTLIVHWDGSAWSVIPSPSPSANYNWLSAVAAVSANDVWAVGGRTGDNVYVDDTLVEQWNGSAWSVVPSPNPGPVRNVLNGVAAVSANDVWAVGEHVEPGGQIHHTLVEHWDGAAWSLVPGANPAPLGTNVLRGVRAVSANDVWAAGFYNISGTYMTMVEHWDGTSWSFIPSPNVGSGSNSLSGVAALSANELWFVGAYESAGTNQTLVEFYTDICPPPTPSGTPESTASPSPTPTASPVLTMTQVRTPTHTPTSSSTSTPTATLASSSTPTNTPTPWPTPTDTRTGTPIVMPSASPTLTVMPCLITFSDVQPSDYFYQAVTYLFCQGVVSGYRDYSFRPYNNATRGQLTKIIVLAEGWRIVTFPGTPTFSDVPPDHPFYQYVETAVSHGIISGYSDGTFRPSNDVTRGQVCKMIVLAENWTLVSPPTPTFSDVLVDSPFYEYIETAYSNSLISGYSDGTFRPGNSGTRGQISKIVYNALTHGIH